MANRRISLGGGEHFLYQRFVGIHPLSHLKSAPVPIEIRQLAGVTEPELVWTNERGGRTYRIGRRFAKWNPLDSGIDLEFERERLAWAGRHHSVPQVRDWGANETAQWLVTAALPGDSAVTPAWLRRPVEAVRAIGRGLRILHDSLPVAECPFDGSVAARTGQRAPEGDLAVPPIDQLVVCHGDPCPPNTLIGPNGDPVGHVDLGSLGIADRWADLAVASSRLDSNYGPGWQAEFFQAYGIEPRPDYLAYYRFLYDHEAEIGIAAGVTAELARLGKMASPT